MAASPIVQTIIAGARQRRIDPQAALAVSRMEGLSGGIGDGGHAFGPFQLNNAGGVITGKFNGQTPDQIQAWAQSPSGIGYALDGIAKVAAGLHGPQAVNAIVSRFERPANPQKEISGALAAYGQSPAGAAGAGAAAPTVSPSPTVGASAPQGLPPILATLLQNARTQAGLGASPIPMLLARPPQSPAPEPAAAPRVAPSTGAAVSGRGIAELLREGTGGPTHSTGPHIHAAFTDPQQELAAISLAQRLGLSIRENPYVGDTVDPVHAPNSYHTRTFPGLFNGRKLGEAIDVSGPAMGQFYSALARRRR